MREACLGNVQAHGLQGHGCGHSTRQTCSRVAVVHASAVLAAGGQGQGACTHACLLLCHPGPCPPCPLVVDAECFCGRQRGRRRCGHHEFSCGAPCGQRLPCGLHRCVDVRRARRNTLALRNCDACLRVLVPPRAHTQLSRALPPRRVPALPHPGGQGGVPLRRTGEAQQSANKNFLPVRISPFGTLCLELRPAPTPPRAGAGARLGALLRARLFLRARVRQGTALRAAPLRARVPRRRVRRVPLGGPPHVPMRRRGAPGAQVHRPGAHVRRHVRQAAALRRAPLPGQVSRTALHGAFFMLDGRQRSASTCCRLCLHLLPTGQVWCSDMVSRAHVQVPRGRVQHLPRRGDQDVPLRALHQAAAVRLGAAAVRPPLHQHARVRAAPLQAALLRRQLLPALRGDVRAQAALRQPPLPGALPPGTVQVRAPQRWESLGAVPLTLVRHVYRGWPRGR